MKKFAMFLAVVGMCTPVTLKLEQPYSKAERVRRLTNIKILDKELRGNHLKLTFESLRREASLLHVSVKRCIDGEFALDPLEILPFEDIMLKCVGENYNIIINFYTDIQAKVRELLKERTKNTLRSGFCDTITLQCVYFFKIVEEFISMDYDVLTAFSLSDLEIKEHISPSTLLSLKSAMSTHLEEYVEVQTLLKKERSFLTDYLQEKFHEYITKYPDAIKDMDHALVLLDRKDASDVLKQKQQEEHNAYFDTIKDIENNVTPEVQTGLDLMNSQSVVDQSNDLVFGPSNFDSNFNL